MGLQTEVVVQDPIEPGSVFRAALEVIGQPRARARPYDYGESRLIQALLPDGVPALVSVHFRRAGDYYSLGERGRPAGFVVVMFGTPWITRKPFGAKPDAASRAHHVALVEQLGSWLDAQPVKWAWRFDTEPWSG